MRSRTLRATIRVPRRAPSRSLSATAKFCSAPFASICTLMRKSATVFRLQWRQIAAKNCHSLARSLARAPLKGALANENKLDAVSTSVVVKRVFAIVKRANATVGFQLASGVRRRRRLSARNWRRRCKATKATARQTRARAPTNVRRSAGNRRRFRRSPFVDAMRSSAAHTRGADKRRGPTSKRRSCNCSAPNGRRSKTWSCKRQ